MTTEKLLSVTISQDSYELIEKYIKEIKRDRSIMGIRLSKILENSNIEALTVADLIDALLKTKKPIMFAERDFNNDPVHSGWTVKEAQLLGRIGYQIPVKSYETHTYYEGRGELMVSQQTKDYTNPRNATLLFTNGALLTGEMYFPIYKKTTGCDFEEVCSDSMSKKCIERHKLKKYLESRLLPLLRSANDASKESSALVVIPGLGTGAFAGDRTFTDAQEGESLSQGIGTIYKEIIQENLSMLTNIKGIIWDGFRTEKEVIAKPFQQEIITNDQTSHQICFIEESAQSAYFVSSSLNRAGAFSEPKDHNTKIGSTTFRFDDCKIFLVVAGDHLSFPGNDAYQSSPHTQEGGVASRTNLINVVTGFENEKYDHKDRHAFVRSTDELFDWMQEHKFSLGLAELTVFKSNVDEPIVNFQYTKSEGYQPSWIRIDIHADTGGLLEEAAPASVAIAAPITPAPVAPPAAVAPPTIDQLISYIKNADANISEHRLTEFTRNIPRLFLDLLHRTRDRDSRNFYKKFSTLLEAFENFLKSTLQNSDKKELIKGPLGMLFSVVVLNFKKLLDLASLEKATNNVADADNNIIKILKSLLNLSVYNDTFIEHMESTVRGMFATFTVEQQEIIKIFYPLITGNNDQWGLLEEAAPASVAIAPPAAVAPPTIDQLISYIKNANPAISKHKLYDFAENISILFVNLLIMDTKDKNSRNFYEQFYTLLQEFEKFLNSTLQNTDKKALLEESLGLFFSVVIINFPKLLDLASLEQENNVAYANNNIIKILSSLLNLSVYNDTFVTYMESHVRRMFATFTVQQQEIIKIFYPLITGNDEVEQLAAITPPNNTELYLSYLQVHAVIKTLAIAHCKFSSSNDGSHKIILDNNADFHTIILDNNDTLVQYTGDAYVVGSSDHNQKSISQHVYNGFWDGLSVYLNETKQTNNTNDLQLPSEIRIVSRITNNNVHWTSLVTTIPITTASKKIISDIISEAIEHRKIEPTKAFNAQLLNDTYKTKVLRHSTNTRSVKLPVDSLTIDHYNSISGGSDFEIIAASLEALTQQNKGTVQSKSCIRQTGNTCGDWTALNGFVAGVLKEDPSQITYLNSVQLRELSSQCVQLQLNAAENPTDSKYQQEYQNLYNLLLGRQVYDQTKEHSSGMGLLKTIPINAAENPTDSKYQQEYQNLYNLLLGRQVYGQTKEHSSGMGLLKTIPKLLFGKMGSILKRFTGSNADVSDPEKPDQKLIQPKNPKCWVDHQGKFNTHKITEKLREIKIQEQIQFFTKNELQEHQKDLLDLKHPTDQDFIGSVKEINPDKSISNDSIVDFFNKENELKLTFPTNPDRDLNHKQKKWINNFLENLSLEEGVILVATANNFNPNDLMVLLEHIDLHNRTPDNDQILLKFESNDYKTTCPVLDHNIRIHNQNIDKLFQKTSENPKLEDLKSIEPSSPNFVRHLKRRK